MIKTITITILCLLVSNLVYAEGIRTLMYDTGVTTQLDNTFTIVEKGSGWRIRNTKIHCNKNGDSFLKRYLTGDGTYSFNDYQQCLDLLMTMEFTTEPSGIILVDETTNEVLSFTTNVDL